MKARPIPFSGPMVSAIQDGRKWQTRRAVTRAALEAIEFCTGRADDTPAVTADLGFFYDRSEVEDSRGRTRTLKHPEWLLYCAEYPGEGSVPVGQGYGAVGDLLWVREAWIASASFDELPPRDLSRDSAIHYLADGAAPAWFSVGRYRHARFMPRWASRLTLEITGVRIERLQDISNRDALAEGVPATWGDWRGNAPQWAIDSITRSDGAGGSHNWDNRSSSKNFELLWTSINGADSWTPNPWVWVIEFKRAATAQR